MKKQTRLSRASGALSPEADKFLAEATAEFNEKQAVMQSEWRFGTGKQWGFDQESGVFRLDFPDGAEFEADGQILGSYCAGNSSWEWAWNNPHVHPAMARDSRKVKELGKRLRISYLTEGRVPVTGGEFLSYLCAIGLKATDSFGAYRGSAGQIEVMILLKRPRWKQRAAA